MSHLIGNHQRDQLPASVIPVDSRQVVLSSSSYYSFYTRNVFQFYQSQSVADPGFPRRPPTVPTIVPNFPKNCMKMKNMGPWRPSWIRQCKCSPPLPTQLPKNHIESSWIRNTKIAINYFVLMEWRNCRGKSIPLASYFSVPKSAVSSMVAKNLASTFKQWRIQYFPEEGGPNHNGGDTNLLLWPISPKTWMKMKNGLRGRRAHPW